MFQNTCLESLALVSIMVSISMVLVLDLVLTFWCCLHHCSLSKHLHFNDHFVKNFEAWPIFDALMEKGCWLTFLACSAVHTYIQV